MKRGRTTARPGRMSTRRPGRMSIALLTLVGSLDAHAQAANAEAAAQAPAATSAQTMPAGPDGGAARLEPVIVQSQRRLERLQDVPISVKAFSSRQIEDMGITSTQDFVNLTPNMSFDNSLTYGNSFVVIRGVTQINNADSPVAVVVDGVPQNNQKQLKMNLFDIQRIEVLKGPQGALYGRNAIGGAINIETKKPTSERQSFAAIEVANGNSMQTTAGTTGELLPKLLYRIDAQAKKSGGLLENTFRGDKVDAIDRDTTVRGRLIYTPVDDLSLDLRVNFNDFRAGANWDSVVRSSNPNDIRNPRSSILGKTLGQSSDVSLKADYQTSLGTLTSITGYTNLTERYRGDIDFSNPTDLPGGFLGLGIQAGQGQNLNTKMLSQEVRLTSADASPLRWIVGAYFLDTRRHLDTRLFVDATSDISQFDDPGKTVVNLQGEDHNRASAGFGQVDYDLSPGLTVSGALRFDRDGRHQKDLRTGSSRDAAFDSWQPKVTLTKHFDGDNLAYATYSTGFRSGGFNSPGLASFRPESLANYELGAKTTLLDKRMILNGAVFYSKSKNFQFFYVDAGSGSQVISNIDRVRIQGADIDFRYLPTRGLEFDGGIGITDGIIARNSVDPGSVGHHTPKNVPIKLNFGVQYLKAVTDTLNGFVRLDVEHRGKKYWHPDNVAVADPMTLFGVRFGVRGQDDKWGMTFYGKNLTNKHYYADYNSAKYSGLPYDIGSLAPLRMYGLELKFRL